MELERLERVEDSEAQVVGGVLGCRRGRGREQLQLPVDEEGVGKLVCGPARRALEVVDEGRELLLGDGRRDVELRACRWIFGEFFFSFVSSSRLRERESRERLASAIQLRHERPRSLSLLNLEFHSTAHIPT